MEPADPSPPETPLIEGSLEPQLIEVSLRLFGESGRCRFHTGDVLVREGEDAGGIWLLLEGHVEMFRTIGDEEMVFHFESAGRLVGLMALSGRQPTFFTCRATDEVEALFLSHEQIRRGLGESSEFSSCLLAVMVHSMGRRNRRSAELLVEVNTLNQQLAAQRDQLQDALATLQEAQDQIIESEKMASLGNLAAGMAHELNNPVAAIMRATEFISKDIVTLLDETPGLEAAAAALPLAMAQPPVGTREEREAKARLAEALDGDRATASRLFSAGIREAGELERLLALRPHDPREDTLARIERGGLLGSSLRNLGNCSHRIAALVRSLKLHARDDAEAVTGIDLNQTFEDTLVILSNKLHGIELLKEYGDLPPVTGHPSRLQQVWVNLIVNAAQAMDGSGRIGIRTRLRTDGKVEATITDNGPGIPEAFRDRLFEHRFTTRAGRVEFGLGLGLPISRMIIENHGGHLSVESVPGRTTFTIELPTQPQTTAHHDHHPLP